MTTMKQTVNCPMCGVEFSRTGWLFMGALHLTLFCQPTGLDEVKEEE